jgi:hypothetical protein
MRDDAIPGSKGATPEGYPKLVLACTFGTAQELSIANGLALRRKRLGNRVIHNAHGFSRNLTF